MFNRKGFTLIELIMVTIILGILAAVAIPRYMTTVVKAEEAAEDAVINSIKAGLEVYASPPGKKLQNLNLMSGGEQALTALSLLFAVFMSNPAPICVLDEVDAPLDDTNADRFCSLVEEISKSSLTKFLVITHHRMTMARVNRLFGVTMPEKGVSQLVSVDLEKAVQIRENE